MLYQEHQQLDGISSPTRSGRRGCVCRLSWGKDRWFFHWQWNGIFPGEEDENAETDKGPGYYTSYVIGAQWFDDEKPLVVTPKAGCSKIDFLQLFSRCLQAGFELEAFSEIYGIDMEQPHIKAPELQSVLSPLIVVHFLSVVRAIVQVD